MELIRGWHNLKPRHRGCVATIGNFDGVHRGHSAVLADTAARARARAVPALAITFEPQPREHFAPESAPARLTRLREKLGALHALAVERVLVLRFDARLAALEPVRFVEDLLVEALDVREVVIGDDFRFGRAGAGDFDLLVAEGARHGFAIARQSTFELNGERVSSSRVRRALASGDLALAEALLGRPYTLCGRVVRGDSLGRSIGFATANIPLGRLDCAVSGVFAARVRGIGEGVHDAMVNVGNRPTVSGRETRLEAHLFGLDRELYGAHLEVELVSRLRDEQRFESLDALKAQLARDAEGAQRALGRT